MVWESEQLLPCVRTTTVAVVLVGALRVKLLLVVKLPPLRLYSRVPLPVLVASTVKLAVLLIQALAWSMLRIWGSPWTVTVTEVVLRQPLALATVTEKVAVVAGLTGSSPVALMVPVLKE
ncbi:hypothetical protein [Spirosoma endbachense]|uniref:hypothetical protein n=1 Tax=Spirosoma endbachense TaxID=2666025 RepID=UPI001E45B776|nr:hypothetical protein [Spirosoma endbachense]